MASSSNDSGAEGGARRKVLNDPAPADDAPAAASSSVHEPVPQLLLPNRPPRDAERKFSFPERRLQNQNVDQFHDEYSDSSDDDDAVDRVDDGDEVGAIGGDEIVQARNPYPAGRGRNDERPVSPQCVIQFRKEKLSLRTLRFSKNNVTATPRFPSAFLPASLLFFIIFFIVSVALEGRVLIDLPPVESGSLYGPDCFF